MGLDMYLVKKLDVKKWSFIKEEDTFEVKVTKWGKEFKHIDLSKICSISVDEMYWRKANQIHNWFVQNVQNWVDDCGEYNVSHEKLEELKKVVTEVFNSIELIDWAVENWKEFINWKFVPCVEKWKIIKNPTIAKTLLPVKSWFFYWGTWYDEYYYSDIKETKEWLDQLFADKESIENYEFFYSSSW